MYCYKCGRPVGQICPECRSRYLPLVDETGTVTSTCPNCKAYLKVCPSCGRLHRILDDVCVTRNCSSRLTESSQSYPTTYGPLDGSRQLYATKTRYRNLPVEFTEDHTTQELHYVVHAVLYRYNRLYGFTDDMMLEFEWNGRAWVESAPRTPLPSPAKQIIDSAVIEDRTVSLGGEVSFQVLQIGDQTHAVNEMRGARPWLQAAGDHKLLWLYKDGYMTMKSLHDRQDLWDANLPFSGDQVNDLVVGDHLIIASDAGLYRYELEYPDYERIDNDDAVRWRRVAAQKDVVVAMGRDNRMGQTILLLVKSDSTPTVMSIYEDCLDFTWADNDIYLVTETKVIRVDVDLWSLASSSRSVTQLPTGYDTVPGILGLRTDQGDQLALKRKSADDVFVVNMLNVETGSHKQLGDATRNLTQVAMAEGVMLLLESDQTTGKSHLSTYRIGG